MTTSEKQHMIDKFLQNFLSMSAFEPEKEQELAIKVCEVLWSVFTNDDEYFLPRYYTISNNLLSLKETDDDLYDRSSSLRELLKNAEAFLKNLTLEDELCKNNNSVKQYCIEPEFKHLVDEFYSSAMHEIIIYEASAVGKRANQSLDELDSVKAYIDDLTAEINRIENTVKQRLSDTDNNLQNAKDELNSARAKLEDADIKLTEADEKLTAADGKLTDADNKLNIANNMLPNLLTTLGIFVSIIIAIVVIYLTVIVNDKSHNLIEIFLSENTMSARIITVLFFGIFSFDLLFVFVYWIAKISGRSIACNCMGCGEEGKCEANKCNAVTRAFKRYWKFFVVNILTVAIMLILLVVHIHGLSNEMGKDVQGSAPTYATNAPTCTTNVEQQEQVDSN